MLAKGKILPPSEGILFTAYTLVSARYLKFIEIRRFSCSVTFSRYPRLINMKYVHYLPTVLHR